MELQSVDPPGNEERDAIQLNDIEEALQESIGDQFPILDLPNEILYTLYPYLDHATRKVLSVVAKMEEIRKKVEINCELLKIEQDHEQGISTIALDEVKRTISTDKLENEIEQIAINRNFERVVCDYWREDEQIRSALTHIKAKEIEVGCIETEEEFECIVQNRESVRISGFSSNLNSVWFYKRMVNLTPKSELKKVTIRCFPNDEKEEFYEKLGIEEYDDPFFPSNATEFRTTNRKQAILNTGYHKFVIFERHLRIEVEEELDFEYEDERGEDGYCQDDGSITFEIKEESYEGKADEEQSKLLNIQVEDSIVRLKLNDEEERVIAFDEVDDEMKKIGKNRFFEKVIFKSNNSADRRPIRALIHIHAAELDIDDTKLTDSECERIFENKEIVNLTNGNVGLCKWFYEKLSEPELDRSEIVSVKIRSLRTSQRKKFMKHLEIDHSNVDSNGKTIYKATNDQQKVHPIEGGVTITEGRLKIVVHENEKCDEGGIDKLGWVSFEICDSDDDFDDSDDSDDESDENSDTKDNE